MEVRNQNLKTSRLRTFDTGSPVKNSMRSRFARTLQAFSTSMNKSPHNSFLFDPFTATEIELEVLSSPNNEAHGLYSSPTNPYGLRIMRGKVFYKTRKTGPRYYSNWRIGRKSKVWTKKLLVSRIIGSKIYLWFLSGNAFLYEGF